MQQPLTGIATNGTHIQQPYIYMYKSYFPGYSVSLTTLLFVAFCEIDMESFAPNLSYKINLIAVGVVALGCTVQQSSYYGFTSMLPKQYTQAVMTGESEYSS